MADTVSKYIVDTRSDAAEEADLDAEPGADLAAQRVILPDVVGEWLLSLAISQTAAISQTVHTQSNDSEDDLISADIGPPRPPRRERP